MTSIMGTSVPAGSASTEPLASGCSARLVEEVFAIDHDPGDLAGGDEAAHVADRDREDQAAALDLLERRLGRGDVADGGGGEVVQLHPHAHGRHAVVEAARDR